MMRIQMLALAGLLAGCSGRFEVVGDDPDAAADASVTLDAAIGTDAGADAPPAVDAAPDVQPEAGRDCDKLRARIESLRPKLLECCPQCRSLQCFTALDDLCCPISTSHGGTTQAKEFSAAVKEYKQSCGPVGCPLVPCRQAPSNDCDPITSTCR